MLQLFCDHKNEIEETLFSPLPASLLPDYYPDRITTRAFVGRSSRSLSQYSSQETLLPSSHHFQTLSPTYSSDESDSAGGTLKSVSSLSQADSFQDEDFMSPSSSLTASPKVKSLFQDGHLFAYSPPDEGKKSLRTHVLSVRQSLSPRSRRSNTDASPLSQSKVIEENSAHVCGPTARYRIAR